MSPLPEHLQQEARGLSAGQSQALSAGSVVAGYTLLEELGRGGMGVVFRAKHPRQPREVAIKILLSANARLSHVKRFQREVSALIRLRHPNIVAALDAGEYQGKPYLVMELVEGPTLDQVLKRGSLSSENALRITHKIALALQHAHEHNVLHRDVKPGNVILDSSGEPRLADFGLTKDLDASLSGTVLSQAGGGMGTPGYWSPEQARGELESIGPATDVYGLGATFYALLTGRPPHGGGALQHVVQMSLKDPSPPSVYRPELGKTLDPICLKCLARTPGDRYPTAGAVAEALAHCRWGAPTQPRRLLGGQALVLFVFSVLGGVGLASWWHEDVGGQPAELTAIDPTASEAERLRERGLVAYNTQGDYRAAIECFTRAIELEPENPETYSSRGYVHNALGDYAAAYNDYTRAIELRPAFAPYHASRAMVRSQLAGC